MRPRLLDLFCGAGGAGMGYYRAGFDVVGVDINPQPHYPFEFHQADAMTYPLEGFDAIHASPPCQAYIRGGTVNKSGRPRLIAPIRERLAGAGPRWVIENVPGAPLRVDLLLCGTMFGLDVRRHRCFEIHPRLPLLAPATCNHGRRIAGVYGNPHGKRGAWRGMLPSDLSTWCLAMGIDWMDSRELTQAIPPAYTEFIGRQLIAALERVV